MFSELCRETLRKAAVCYTSGRAGSPSTSPPTSPPSSPAKEAKTTANVELANVHRSSTATAAGGSAGGCASGSSSASINQHQHDEIRHHQENASSTCERSARSYQQSTTSTTNEARDYATGRSHSPEHRGKRTAMPTDFGRRSAESHRYERRRSSHSMSDDYRGVWGDGGGGGGSGASCRSSSAPSAYWERDWQHTGYESIGTSAGGRSRSESSGSSPEPDEFSTSGDEAGAAPEESNQRSSSAHHRHSLTKEKTMQWFAHIGGDEEPVLQRSDVKRRSLYDEDSLDGDHPNDNQGREGSAKDVDRAKLVRDRQNEERQRKLEELRQQALAAQRFREQREEERRRRIDELRSRDSDRRNQVEERKRLIWEAERERREAILRKNQEREARIEARKKNERSHIVFAFGSSTPRMLEPADTGGSSFWGTRRATSTTNVMMFPAAQPLTRRSSERELDGSKKRATSAGGLDRKPGEDMRMSSSMYEVFNWNSSPDPSLTHAKNKRASLSLPPTTDIFAIDDNSDNDTTRRPMMQRAITGEDSDGAAGTPSSVYLRVNRRRTDLMPTIPSPRDGGSTTGRSSSAKAFARSPGVRSGEVTPNSPSRPHSSMSQQSGSSVGSSNVNLRPRTTTPRRPRPASIAGTGVSVTERHNLVGDIKVTKDSKPPLPKVHSTPKKPSTPKATESAKKPTDKLIKSAKASPRVTPKATPLQSPGAEHPPLIRENTTEMIKHNNGKDAKDAKSEEKQDEKKDQGTEKSEELTESAIAPETTVSNTQSNGSVSSSKTAKEEANVVQEASGPAPPQVAQKKEENGNAGKKSPEPEVKAELEVEEIDMSASMIAKTRITTEEEAKAALAERRRLAREQAEREAELERQRLEEEERLEAERLLAEEEEQRRLEVETLRLANEARAAEEQRLQQAIEETRRREEEDRKRREEEARQKIEKEEADRKAREEAEKQRLEMVERLKKEEEERLQRRKRVEAIMLRTRGKNQPNTPTKGEGGDGDKLKEDSPSEEIKPVPGSNRGDDVMTASLISEATQQFINVEQQVHHDGNNTQPDIVRNGTHRNGINETKTLLENSQDNDEGELNGHHTNHGNGINSQSIALDNATVKQNNVTNNLLDLSEFDTLSNSGRGPILELSGNLSNEDSLNSNLNPAAMPFTPMVNLPFVPAAANANANPFQDGFTNNKSQDNNQVPDLLS